MPHFIQEDVGDELAQRVVSFMEANPLTPCQEVVTRNAGVFLPPGEGIGERSCNLGTSDKYPFRQLPTA